MWPFLCSIINYTVHTKTAGDIQHYTLPLFYLNAVTCPNQGTSDIQAYRGCSDTHTIQQKQKAQFQWKMPHACTPVTMGKLHAPWSGTIWTAFSKHYVLFVLYTLSDCWLRADYLPATQTLITAFFISPKSRLEAPAFLVPKKLHKWPESPAHGTA